MDQQVSTDAEKMQKLEVLFAEVMKTLGLDLTHPDMTDTPHRLAKMYKNELFAGLQKPTMDLTVFPNTEKYDEMIIEKDIEFFSVCAHHWMPFFGKVTIGYLPRENYVGLSKLARVVEHFARRPQVQERLTTQVAEFLFEKLQPKGIIVVCKAEHLCMSARGIKKPRHETITSCIKGTVDKAEFLALTANGGHR